MQFATTVLTAVAGAAIAILSLTASGACQLPSIASSLPPWTTRTAKTTTPTYRDDACITRATALQAADVYRLFIEAYTDELALETLTEGFVDWSSAVNIIRNKGGDAPFNLTAPTFTGRRAFMEGQGAQPPITFEMLGVWHGCDSVSMRWVTTRSANGQRSEVAKLPVIGNSIVELVPDAENRYGFRIKTLFAEFNAAAWLVNLGVFAPATLVNVQQ